MSGRFFNSEEKGSGSLPGRALVLELTLSLSGVAGVHLYNGSFGLLQVGIPPETIKTYMSKVPNFVVARAVVHPPCWSGYT